MEILAIKIIASLPMASAAIYGIHHPQKAIKILSSYIIIMPFMAYIL
ncbi:MAG: hypothetical protein PHO62_10970 [Sulfurimonas sp.]|nr:hypothetical protein [Sulfurimonas sp.]MDD5373932.1 hypothetical protein [Sulfurimonas sp.]